MASISQINLKDPIGKLRRNGINHNIISWINEEKVFQRNTNKDKGSNTDTVKEFGDY